jgi:hypothetical protein
MGDPSPPDATIVELLRRLDDLIADAQRLREQTEQATRQEAVWPERLRAAREQPKRGGEKK